MKQSIIELNHIKIAFEDKTVIQNLGTQIEENKIYGLLGKSGSGKTTLLNSIVGGIEPEAGGVKIYGEDPYTNPQVLENICIVREQEIFAPDITVKEIFSYYHIFYPNYDKKLQSRLVDFFGLPIQKSYKTFSRGMKTLVTNIIGLCSKAPIVIYDEPTIGLDAVSRTQFYEILLQEYTRFPQTIIISTHQIEEMENLLEQVIILNEGHIILDDSLESIKEKAYYLTGRAEHLEKLKILQGKNPKQKFGKMETYACYGRLNKQDLNDIETHDIELRPMALQKLFIELTKGKEFTYEGN